MRPFEVAFYAMLTIATLLTFWTVELQRQIAFAESLILQDALMELVYQRRYP